MVLALVEQTICTRCGEDFSDEQIRNHRQFCDICRVANRADFEAARAKSPKRIAQRLVYEQTPKRKASHTACIAIRMATPEGRAAHLDAQRRYIETPRGKVYMATYQVAYRNSSGGQAAIAKGFAKRRERSTDPDLFAARVELLHILKESCAMCGELYKRSYQIDHILALCNGGIDKWDNYRPLCLECHGVKTREDLRLFWGSKK